MKIRFGFLFLLCAIHVQAQKSFKSVLWGLQMGDESITSLYPFSADSVIMVGYEQDAEGSGVTCTVFRMGPDLVPVQKQSFSYGDKTFGLSMHGNANREFAICGEYHVGLEFSKAFVSKHRIDETGNTTLWSQTIKYEQGAVSLADLVICSDGGVVAVGFSSATTNPGTNNVFAVKYSALGELQWTRSFFSSSNAYAQAVLELPSGELVLSADVQQLQNGRRDYDIQLIKISANGDSLRSIQLGEEQEDGCQSISLHPNGDIFLCGEATGRSGVGFDGILARFTPDLETVFFNKYPLVGSDAYFEIIPYGSDSVLVSGYSNSEVPEQPIDAVLLQFSTDGDLSQAWYQGGAQVDVAYGLGISADGAIWMAGSSINDDNAQYYVLRYASNPNGMYERSEDKACANRNFSTPLNKVSDEEDTVSLKALDGSTLAIWKAGAELSKPLVASGVYLLEIKTKMGLCRSKIFIP